MPKMNPKIKKRWVAALRSGKYEQGQSYLNKDGKFCCLGVLCELAVEDGVIEREQDSYERRVYGYDTIAYDGQSRMPSEAIQEWAGIEGHTPWMVPTQEDEVRSLDRMNDEGATFEEIANVIQRRF